MTAERSAESGRRRASGLDVEQLIRDLADPAPAARVREDVAGAEASGARGTPTFFVGSMRHRGAYDAVRLGEALEASRPQARVGPATLVEEVER